MTKVTFMTTILLSQTKQGLAATDAGNTIREAYFGAGDSEQLAPFFRDLGYRGVKSVSTGMADGREIVCVKYDPVRTPYSDLLRVYFRR